MICVKLKPKQDPECYKLKGWNIQKGTVNTCEIAAEKSFGITSDPGELPSVKSRNLIICNN